MDPLTLAAALTLGAVLIGGRRRRKRKRGECYPLVWRPAAVRDAILDVFEAGDCDHDEIAVAAAGYVYPELPHGGAAVWPPSGTTEPYQKCVWDKVFEEVETLAGQEGVTLCRLGEPTSIVKPATVGFSLQWDEIVDKYTAGDTPHHGFFYQVRPTGHSAWAEGAETLSKVATAALINALDEIGIDPQAALATDDNGVRYLVRDMMVLIECAPTNDAVLSSPKSELGSKGNPGSGHYAPHGRGISFNKVHADNLARMRDGLPMLRTVVNGGRMDGSDAEHDGHGGYHPTVWIPLLNLDALNGGVVTTQDMFWPDGQSTIVPPPEIMALGRPDNVPSGEWGCDGLEIQ